ncbi:MAG TPA: hypothetical protein VHC93_10890 [Methylomirabilota bacterium]|nr:hypothetical protein [Methylomirabilota bacterium]
MVRRIREWTTVPFIVLSARDQPGTGRVARSRR